MPIGLGRFPAARRWPLIGYVLTAIALTGLIVMGLSWWLTPSLESLRSRDSVEQAAAPVEPAAKTAPAREWPDWPEARLEGPPAKTLLLAWLEACEKSIRAVDG